MVSVDIGENENGMCGKGDTCSLRGQEFGSERKGLKRLVEEMSFGKKRWEEMERQLV